MFFFSLSNFLAFKLMHSRNLSNDGFKLKCVSLVGGRLRPIRIVLTVH